MFMLSLSLLLHGGPSMRPLWRGSAHALAFTNVAVLGALAVLGVLAAVKQRALVVAVPKVYRDLQVLSCGLYPSLIKPRNFSI